LLTTISVATEEEELPANLPIPGAGESYGQILGRKMMKLGFAPAGDLDNWGLLSSQLGSADPVDQSHEISLPSQRMIRILQLGERILNGGSDPFCAHLMSIELDNARPFVAVPGQVIGG
jgi:hypothetical protein